MPRVARGLKVRAKSKPTTDPGPPTEMTTTSTTSSQYGAGPGSARTAVHTAALVPMMPSTSQDRRCGWRPVRTPMTTPASTAVTTETINRPPAASRETP